MTNILRYLLTLCLFAGVMFADSISKEVLKEFDIKHSESNLKTIKTIKNSIDEKDIASFKDMVDNRSFHINMILDEIEAIDAPEFLLYLAMTESRLKNSVTSHKKAAGMWQIMPKTAKVFGLTVNEYIDERRDPFASTDAAFRYIDYLKNGYSFDKWYISLMAYNCGQGCINKAIKNTGSDDLSSLLASPHVPKETKNFIKNIIKLSIISKENDMINSENLQKNRMKFAKISVNSGTKLSDVSKNIGVNLEDMKKYNLHITKGVVPNGEGNYYFYIPQNKLNAYAKSLNFKKHTVVAKDELSNTLRKYKVQKGDTLHGISAKFNVELKEIVSTNDLKSSKIKVGEVIVIP
ncbi:MAG: transglycosylase SLT domain-containing protein [Campylobacter sp.]|nr:transglycosylase SLT domain-containing protein [Campylobacter sp.]